MAGDHAAIAAAGTPQGPEQIAFVRVTALLRDMQQARLAPLRIPDGDVNSMQVIDRQAMQLSAQEPAGRVLPEPLSRLR
jgi:hypothetical protein